MIIGRPKFVLASGSPRRLTLVNQIGIEPDALRPADIDEMHKKGELPRACANRLARAKAETAPRKRSSTREEDNAEKKPVGRRCRVDSRGAGASARHRGEQRSRGHRDRRLRVLHVVLYA